MKPFHGNVFDLAKKNSYFRQEVATANHSQVVLMSIKPGEEIGAEVHTDSDQLLCFVAGTGKAIVAGQEYALAPGDCVLVPSGTKHNFINTGSQDLKLFTVYAPAHHKPGTVHKTKAEAEKY